MHEYMKQVLKAKGSLENCVDKIKAAVAGDAKADQRLAEINLSYPSEQVQEPDSCVFPYVVGDTEATPQSQDFEKNGRPGEAV